MQRCSGCEGRNCGARDRVERAARAPSAGRQDLGAGNRHKAVSTAARQALGQANGARAWPPTTLRHPSNLCAWCGTAGGGCGMQAMGPRQPAEPSDGPGRRGWASRPPVSDWSHVAGRVSGHSMPCQATRPEAPLSHDAVCPLPSRAGSKDRAAPRPRCFYREAGDLSGRPETPHRTKTRGTRDASSQTGNGRAWA